MQLRNHVPVDGAQSLKGIECTRPARKGFVVEYLFKNAENGLCILFHQAFIIGLFQIIKCGLHIARISEIPVKMIPAKLIYVDELPMAVGHQLFQQCGFAHQVFGYVVLPEEPWQLLIGIQHVAVLIFTVKGAVTHGIQNVQRLLCTRITRAEHSHLALEHFAQMFNRDAVFVIAHQVVGMIEMVRPAVGLDGVLQVLQGGTDEAGNAFELKNRSFAAKAVLVDTGAVDAAGAAKGIGDFFTVEVVDRTAKEITVFIQNFCNPVEKACKFIRNLNLTVL